MIEIPCEMAQWTCFKIGFYINSKSGRKFLVPNHDRKQKRGKETPDVEKGEEENVALRSPLKVDISSVKADANTKPAAVKLSLDQDFLKKIKDVFI